MSLELNHLINIDPSNHGTHAENQKLKSEKYIKEPNKLMNNENRKYDIIVFGASGFT